MAIRGLSMSEREEVILESDPGHPDTYKKACVKAAEMREKHPKQVSLYPDPVFEEPTRFYLKPLSKGCRIELGDMGPSPTMRDGAVTMQLRGTQRAYALVERALVGWTLADDDDKPIKFVPGTIATAHGMVPGASSESMMFLPQHIIGELAGVVLRKNGMTKELVGNSEAPSLQLEGLPSETGPATDAQPTSNEKEAAPKKQ